MKNAQCLTHLTVSELMSPKAKRTKPTSTPTTVSSKAAPQLPPAKDLNSYFGSDALGAYIAFPTSFPSTRVLSYDDNFVAIRDLYPKSSVHLLLLPRDTTKALQHPFDAFEDADFLARTREAAIPLKKLVASELRRNYSKISKSSTAREAAMNADPPPHTLPKGRDWEKEVLIGVHAHPSMSHLHVHVLSRDHVSECMRHRKHYNSFATPFLVPLEDMPLARDDVRRRPGRQGYLDHDLLCWRCGKNFGRGFAKLKQHLAEEFESWKME